MQTNQKEVKNEVVEKKSSQFIKFEKNIADSVTNRVHQLTNEGRLNLPQGYSVGNAINSAYLIITDGGFLETCTKESIANALLDMAIMGHNPAKKHGYFIKYGNKLTWFPSYFGKAAVVKRLDGITTEPIATLIYAGDELVLKHTSLGEEEVIEHVTSWQNKLKGEIVGVYASVMQGDIKRSAVMTMAEVVEAWTKNPSKGNNRDHKEFRGEFAKRTVLNRLMKMIIQTSNDDDLLAETFVNNEDNHYEFVDVEVEETVKKEIATNANTGEVIDIEEDEEEVIEPIIEEDIPQEQPKEQQSLFENERETVKKSRGF